MRFFREICNPEILKESWRKARKIRDRSLPDPAIKWAWEAEMQNCLGDLRGRLIQGTYHPGLISRFHTRKKNGKIRMLHILPFEDRIVQNAINLILAPYFEGIFLERSYAFRPGRSCFSLVNDLYQGFYKGFAKGLKVDISSFFDEIDHTILLKFLEYHTGDTELCELVRRLLTVTILDGNERINNRKGISQGMNIAPLLSNLYLHPLDKYFHKKGNLYRYADDLIFLCNGLEEANQILHLLQRILFALKLRLKRESIEMIDIRTGFYHLGYFIRKDKCFRMKKHV